LWTGGPSGGVRPGTAGSPILSVKPPRGARTVAWDRTTCQTGGQRQVPGAATAGCLAATMGHQGSPTRWGLLPWGPPLWECPLGCSQAGPPRWVRVRVHMPLRGASRGNPPRGVRRGRLGCRAGRRAPLMCRTPLRSIQPPSARRNPRFPGISALPCPSGRWQRCLVRACR